MYVYTYGNKKPIISIIGCIHGDEPSGKKFNTKKMYTNLFDYVPSEKENMLSIRYKNPVDIKNQ